MSAMRGSVVVAVPVRVRTTRPICSAVRHPRFLARRWFSKTSPTSSTLWHSMAFWPPVTWSCKGDVAEDVAIHRRSKPTADRKTRDTGELVRFHLRSLLCQQYKKCEGNSPYSAWLRPDIDLAFKQLYDSGLRDVMAPVLQSEVFGQLLEVLGESFQQLDIEQVSEVLLLVLYAGVDKNALLLRRLYMKARQGVAQASWFGVSNLLHAAAVMGRADYSLYRQVLNRMKEDLQTGHIYQHPGDMHHFVKAISVCPPLYSSVLRRALSHEVCRIFSHSPFMNDTQNVTLWTAAASGLYDGIELSEQIRLEKCLLKLGKVTKPFKNQFSLLQMGRIMRTIRYIYPVNAPPLFSVLHVIQSPMYEYLRVKDLLVLAACLSRTAPTLRKELLVRLEKGLTEYVQHEVRPGPEDLEHMFIVTSEGGLHADLRRVIGKFFYRDLSKLMDIDLDRFLLTIRRDEYLSRQTYNKAAVLFHTFSGISNKRACISAAFVILCGGKNIPDEVSKKLLKFLPNCDLSCLTLILQAFGECNLYGPGFKYRHIYWILGISRYVKQRILESNQHAPDPALSCFSLRQLYLVFSALMGNGDVKCIVDTAKIVMQEIEKFCRPPSTCVAEDWSRYLCIKYRWYSPVVMEFCAAAATAVVSDVDEYEQKRLYHALFLCGTFAHTPDCDHVWQDSALRLFDKCLSTNDYYRSVCILYALSGMDIYPEEELSRLFSDEVLSKIASCSSGKNRFFMHMLLSLNLDAVLRSAPGVRAVGRPWRARIAGTAWTERVYRKPALHRALLDICGGAQYVRPRMHIGNDYVLDFAVGFDASGSLLRVGEDSFEWSPGDEKVAIFLIHGNKLAANNSDILLQDYVTLRRNLKLLGFDVLFVCEALRPTGYKCGSTLLRKALFKKLTRKAMPVVHLTETNH